MILDILKTDNPDTYNDLEKINALLESDTFLKAIGAQAITVASPSDFPVQTDIILAGKMMYSQEIWDMPEPWPYQYFVGVIEDGADFYRHVDQKERLKIQEEYLNSSRLEKFGNKLDDAIDRAFEKNSVEQFLLLKSKEQGANGEEAIFIIKDVFPNNISAYLEYLVQAAYYGGINKFPVFERIYEAFTTGGVPCGWVGKLPENGGNPKECIQLLHFGNKGT